ncbi:nucleotide-binding universal stress UspA family protein [Dongia mobilis]|uniref:Nucleotide-binding universal stress UspA family protein n=1 Tax=Dongia mobilis TaxID=578943 RepID=A0A4R6WM17_9PROT|nr:universal stress protein [Dongia mobilis]TDQ82012.1 nucleotide-binding universal stress UspA family protein [Dongia mobilis]
MAIKNILCAVDGSKNTGRVAECAIDLARATGAKLVFLNIDIVPARTRRTYFWDAELMNAADAQSHKQLALAAKAARAAKFDAFTCVSATGHNVADAIVAYADKMKADHIVMGTHTTSELARIFMGSVATAVVSHAKAPVTIVK